MLTSRLAKMGHGLIKVSVVAAEPERKVGNGKTLRQELESKLVKKACWLSSSCTQMDGVSRESHTH